MMPTSGIRAFPWMMHRTPPCCTRPGACAWKHTARTRSPGDGSVLPLTVLVHIFLSTTTPGTMVSQRRWTAQAARLVESPSLHALDNVPTWWWTCLAP